MNKLKDNPIEFDEFLQRPVSYYPIFKLVSGSASAAVMLSQAHFWTFKGKLPDGWFFKTVDEWQEETGLTRYEQETARAKLRQTGFWQEGRRGVPATLHFRIDRPKLREAMVLALANYKEERGKEATRRSKVAFKRAQLKSAALPPTAAAVETRSQHDSGLDSRSPADSDAEVQRTITESTQRVPESTASCGQPCCPQHLENLGDEGLEHQSADEADDLPSELSSSSAGTKEELSAEVEVIYANRESSGVLEANGNRSFGGARHHQTGSNREMVHLTNDNPLYVAVREACDVILGSSSGARLKNAAAVTKALIKDGATVEDVRAAAQWCRRDKYKCRNWVEPTFLQDGYTFIKYGKGELNYGQQNSKIDGFTEFIASCDS